jgi:hypothetical protein
LVWAATESRTYCVAPFTDEPIVTLPWFENETVPDV